MLHKAVVNETMYSLHLVFRYALSEIRGGKQVDNAMWLRCWGFLPSLKNRFLKLNERTESKGRVKTTVLEIHHSHVVTVLRERRERRRKKGEDKSTSKLKMDGMPTIPMQSRQACM